jgi:hypothetical protein
VAGDSSSKIFEQNESERKMFEEKTKKNDKEVQVAGGRSEWQVRVAGQSGRWQVAGGRSMQPVRLPVTSCNRSDPAIRFFFSSFGVLAAFLVCVSFSFASRFFLNLLLLLLSNFNWPCVEWQSAWGQNDGRSPCSAPLKSRKQIEGLSESVLKQSETVRNKLRRIEHGQKLLQTTQAHPKRKQQVLRTQVSKTKLKMQKVTGTSGAIGQTRELTLAARSRRLPTLRAKFKSHFVFVSSIDWQ